MLNDYEKNSLKMIFDRVGPTKLVSFIETLIGCYSNNYSDVVSAEMIKILNESVIKMKEIENEKY